MTWTKTNRSQLRLPQKAKKLLPQRMSLSEARRLGVLNQANQPVLTKTPSNKYGAKRTLYNGRWFSSKREADRAGELDLLVRSGYVRSWEAQPKFPIEHNGVKICSYFADFKVEYPDGHIEIEDVKGFKPAVYKLKKKLVKAFYGIDIKEL